MLVFRYLQCLPLCERWRFRCRSKNLSWEEEIPENTAKEIYSGKLKTRREKRRRLPTWARLLNGPRIFR
jgi:hypothetical protein